MKRLSAAGLGRGLARACVRALFGLQTAVGGVLAHRLRSALTVLGVTIGVASVITMLAVGHAARLAIVKQFESLGTNLIVMEIHRWDMRFDTGDADEMEERVPTILAAVPVLEHEARVKCRREISEMSVLGVDEDFPLVRDHSLAAGRFFGPLHVEQRARVAVLGMSAAQRLFSGRNPIGQGMYIDGQRFTVIGVLEYKGKGMAGDIDDYILLPISSARRVAMHGHISKIWAKAKDRPSAEAAVTQLGRILNHKFNLDQLAESPDMPYYSRSRRFYGPYDYYDGPPWMRPGQEAPEQAPVTVTSMNAFIKEAGEAKRVMTVMLGGIAGVSLLVGGLGIMNIMLVSVSERTREIGTRMAVGATKRDLLFQFVAEALFISLLGAILGVGLGWVGGRLFERYGLQAVVTVQGLLTAGLAAVGVGLLFGAYPAYVATSLPPADALRHP